MKTQPSIEQVWPSPELWILLSQADSVIALLENVKLRRNASLTESGVEADAVLDRHHGITPGVEQETGWRVAGHLLLITELLHLCRVRVGAKQVAARSGMGDLRFHTEYAIRQHGEVGTIAYAIDRIPSVGMADIEVRGDCGCEMASSGKAPNADAVGADAEFRRMGTDIAQGTFAIKNRCGIVVSRSDAVMEHKGSDTAIVEPTCYLSALVVQREMLVAAAGDNDKRAPRRRLDRDGLAGGERDAGVVVLCGANRSSGRGLRRSRGDGPGLDLHRQRQGAGRTHSKLQGHSMIAPSELPHFTPLHPPIPLGWGMDGVRAGVRGCT